ncbi:GlcG/HbpS family heme-binding protein [Aliivibrio kagoshimensis]|uniref:GlcG/HbpS family heme-binding protein n=1 Tax=Aliivibrio kagoshimensis TaxID=2910230 RepID=UPI003D152DFD
MTLTLQDALKITDGAFQASNDQKAAPLTIAILDTGGRLISLQRQDGASMMRPDIAIAKAWGALAMGCSSRTLATTAEQRPAFMSAVTSLAEGNILPVPGGVLIKDHQQQLIGAVGISGDLSEIDEQCAILGIETANLLTDAI